MMTLMPKSAKAHGACSREEPQPKLSPATKIEGLTVLRFVQDEIGDFVALTVIAHLVKQVHT